MNLSSLEGSIKIRFLLRGLLESGLSGQGEKLLLGWVGQAPDKTVSSPMLSGRGFLVCVTLV